MLSSVGLATDLQTVAKSWANERGAVDSVKIAFDGCAKNQPRLEALTSF